VWLYCRYERCVLLADVVAMLGLTRHRFTTSHHLITVHRITWTEFETQTMIADFKSIRRRIEDMHTNDEQRDEHRDHTSIETMSCSDFSDDDSIEVVIASMDLLAVLGNEVVTLQ